MTDTQRLTNYYIARANDELRARLAESDQQIEWLSKENAALKRHAEEVTKGLIELRGVQIEALAVARERVARDAAEIAKWKAEAELAIEWYKSYKHQRETYRIRNEELRARVAFLEKALNSKPGTMSIGPGGLVVLSYGTPPQEVLDAARSLRAEHFRNYEDEWYSCPKSGECWNDLAADVCTCGADEQNAAVDVVMAYLTGGGE